MAHNEALIEERDAGIREIAGQIAEVNEMFQDLAVLINDQGVQVGGGVHSFIYCESDGVVLKERTAIQRSIGCQQPCKDASAYRISV